MKQVVKFVRDVSLGLLISANSGFAANVLVNPGFEWNAPGQSQDFVSWTWFGQPWGNTLNESGSPARSGNNYFKVFQGFTGSVNYSGLFQDYISGPDAKYSADGWAYTSSSDSLSGQNVAWIEVTFRDATSKILALYRSATITTNAIASGAFPKNTWVHLAVTNQLNPNTFAITNTTPTLTAPAGTHYVRYQIVLQGDALNSGGSVYFDDLALNQVGGAPYGNWNVVWSDEFNDAQIDPDVWAYDLGAGGWGNSELEYYTSRSQNAFEADGLLNIVARRESFGGQNYTSARLKTQGRISWKYGRFEWRARFPSGVGVWPALWLLGTNITSVGWPKCGEIDAVEIKGHAVTNIQGSLHSGSDSTAIYTFPNGESATNFHTYVLDWTTNAFLFFVDGQLYQTQTNWWSEVGPYPTPFNKPFFVIMNMAIGGNYVGNPSNAEINAGTIFPAAMQVDYLRIYNQTPPLKISLTPTNGGIMLSWPSNIVCRLQEQVTSPPFGLASDWNDLAITSNAAWFEATNEAAFYRLQSP